MDGKNHWIASTLLGHGGCLRRQHLLHHLTPYHHILGTTSHNRHAFTLPQRTHGNIGAHSRSVQQHIITLSKAAANPTYNRTTEAIHRPLVISPQSRSHHCPIRGAHPPRPVRSRTVGPPSGMGLTSNKTRIVGRGDHGRQQT